MKRHFIQVTIIQFILLFAFWLLLSGKYDSFHIILGIISCLLVILLNLRLNRYYVFQEKLEVTDAKIMGKQPTRLRISRLMYYIPWLLLQIIVASLQVAYVVLRPRMPINPALIRFHTNLPTMASKVILGNSITLTPGTITIQINEDEFLVHALMDESSTAIIDGTLPEQVARLYDKKPAQVVKDVKIIRDRKNA